MQKENPTPPSIWLVGLLGMSLTNKRIAFVEHYLVCWNASEAARRASYAHPGTEGHRLLQNAEIQAYIKARLAESAMCADEVLSRLTEIGRSETRDSLKALELMGKHHRLFVDVQEVTATHAVSDKVLDAISGALERGYGELPD